MFPFKPAGDVLLPLLECHASAAVNCYALYPLTAVTTPTTTTTNTNNTTANAVSSTLTNNASNMVTAISNTALLNAAWSKKYVPIKTSTMTGGLNLWTSGNPDLILPRGELEFTTLDPTLK
ncbi:hypothetical protein FF38_12774 [Lucilia cuprina]|uniref:Uncharacterized protein n=1 Tax=Lucilia cuprina TaxID=7375 RepID=A0A0L0CHB9_LUCCU|nr:hypothetical protein FF38_12774 [Lucilia cuprina]